MVEHEKVFAGVRLLEFLGHRLELLPGSGQLLIMEGFLTLLLHGPGQAPVTGGKP